MNSPHIPEKKDVRNHFDEIASDYDKWKKKNAYYYENIQGFIKRIVPPNSNVLEIGCGTGEILASLAPQHGVGIDISPEMINIAREKYPQYTFIDSPIEDYKEDKRFDYIVLVDLLDHIYDMMDIFESIYRFCHPNTKIVLTTVNPWWDPVLSLTEKLGMKMPEGPHNFIEKRNIQKILELLHFSISYSGYLLLMPKYIPIVSYFFNTLGTRLWGINKFSLIQYMILQPTAKNHFDLGLSCSVIIPYFKNYFSLEKTIKEMPKIAENTEIIIIKTKKKDISPEEIKHLESLNKNIKIINSPSKHKSLAVKAGVEAANNDIIIIHDADLILSSKELPRFYAPLNQSLCQFVNGTRMIYPMAGQKMRTINLIGNKIFSLIMSFITGQNFSDILCTTKSFYKKDYEYYKLNIDQYGDLDLLLGAAKKGNKIMEVPVHPQGSEFKRPWPKTLRILYNLIAVSFKGFIRLVFQTDK